MLTTPIVQIALISLVSILSQWLGWLMKIPAIVMLLIAGFVLGSILNIVQPEIIFNTSLQPIISVAVGLILFEGSLNLNFREIKQARRIVWQICFIGGAVSWLLISCSAHYLAGLSWPVAVTFGALLIVTGPTVIMPLLRQSRLNMRVGSILKWEGIVNDPVGAVLAVLCYEYFKISSHSDITISAFALDIGFLILVIAALSILAGLALSKILNKGWVPEFLKAAFLLSFVICVFVSCNALLHESGLIAVTILGVVLANTGVTSLEDLKRFKESITILLVSGVFVVLTATIKPDVLLNIDWRGGLFILSVLFFIRPISTFIASFGTTLNWRELSLISMIAPRGVVCAAIAGILGPLLMDAGYADGERLLPLAFAIVVGSVVIHGLSAKPLGQKLGLAFPARDGLIIVGATDWTVQFAETLQSKDINVMLADKNWSSLKSARLANIPIYYGEILSDETEHSLELNKYNTLLAATGNGAYNALICNVLGHEFGRERVFQLSTDDEDFHERQQMGHTMGGRTLAYEGLDYWGFARLYREGWRFKTTKVSVDFNLEKIKEEKANKNIKLIGVIKPSGQLQFSQAENPENIKADNTVILFTKEDLPEKPKEKKKKKKKVA